MFVDHMEISVQLPLVFVPFLQSNSHGPFVYLSPKEIHQARPGALERCAHYGTCVASVSPGGSVYYSMLPPAVSVSYADIVLPILEVRSR